MQVEYREALSSKAADGVRGGVLVLAAPYQDGALVVLSKDGRNWCDYIRPATRGGQTYFSAVFCLQLPGEYTLRVGGNAYRVQVHWGRITRVDLRPQRE